MNKASEQILILLGGLFAMLIVLSNIISQKFVHINFLYLYDIELSAGTLLYPFTFVITDLIAEFYGRENAKICVRAAIIISICSASILLCIQGLDAAVWSHVDNAQFSHVFGHYSTVLIGSLLASYVSQNLDIWLYLKLRELTSGKFLWIRSNVTTFVALTVDSAIMLTFMSLRGAIPYDQLPNIMMNTVLFKIFFAAFSTPLFYLASYVISSLNGGKVSVRFTEQN